MDEKELRLKAMEITRDIVVAAIEKEMLDIPAEVKNISSQQVAGVSVKREKNAAILMLIEDVFTTVYNILAK